MFPPAPDLFSTTTGWPSASCSRGATNRASASLVLPTMGTMILIGLVGAQSWAMAAPEPQVVRAATVHTSSLLIAMSGLAALYLAGAGMRAMTDAHFLDSPWITWVKACESKYTS